MAAPGDLIGVENGSPVAEPDPAGVLAGGRRALGTTGDDTGRRGVPPSARRSAWWRLAVLAVAIAVVYGRTIASLPSSLTVDSPLAYAALAPLAALVLAVLGIRESAPGPAVLPLRQSDLLCGGALLGLAVLVGWAGPGVFGFASTPWRVSMASLPFFLAGAVWVLFGGRAAWWSRHSFFFAALAAPVWYVWVLTPLLDVATVLTWFVVAPLARLVGAQTVDASGTGLVAIGDQLAAVSEVCSGASSMVAWMIVGGALATRLAGPRGRRWRWLVAGGALAWVANAVRILVVVVVGRYASVPLALDWVHPVAGLLAITALCALMLRIAGRMGLDPIQGEHAPVIGRLAAVAPTDARVPVAAVALAASVLSVLIYVGGWRFDQLGGRNGQLNTPVATRLSAAGPVVVDGRAWVVRAFGEVPWASQYFGRGASWNRFSLFAPTDGDRSSWAVAVDTTEVSDAVTLDAFPLEACYGFHGFGVKRSEVVGLLTDRPAERIDYLDEAAGVRTVVVSWRQRVPGERVERVVVSAPARTSEVTAATAALPDVATAEQAVVLVARELAEPGG